MRKRSRKFRNRKKKTPILPDDFGNAVYDLHHKIPVSRNGRRGEIIFVPKVEHEAFTRLFDNLLPWDNEFPKRLERISSLFLPNGYKLVVVKAG